VSRTLNPQSANLNASTPSKIFEPAARETLRAHLGRALTDVEWAQARVRLLEFVTILRRWNDKANTPASGVGNVE